MVVLPRNVNIFRVTPQTDPKIIVHGRNFAKILMIMSQDLANLRDRAKYLARSLRFGEISRTLKQIFVAIVTTRRYSCDYSGEF